MNFTTLPSFYQSPEWRKFRRALIAERTAPDGFLYDEHSGKPILRGCDAILHHKEELTLRNVNDASVSLNPDNIMIVSPQSHNEIHNRWGGRLKPYQRKVYYVWGAPLSGKSTYVRNAMLPGDLVLDIDRLWEALSGMPRYSKPSAIKPSVFAARDAVFETIRTRAGSWQNAWVIEGGAREGDRRRRMDALGAEGIFIPSDLETSLQRLSVASDARKEAGLWEGYIRKWFDDYQPEPEM